MEGFDKENIHRYIGRGGDRQEEEGGLAVSQCGEDAGGEVIEEYKGQAPYIDIQVQGRVCKDLLRGIDQLQQSAAAQDAHQHQHGAGDTAGDHGGGNGGFHIPVLPRAKKLGDQHRAADVAAKGEGDEDQGDLIAVAHSRQGILSDELTGHPAVRNIIQLLEHNAAEQRQTEFPEDGGRLSYSQIVVHIHSPFFYFSAAYYSAFASFCKTPKSNKESGEFPALFVNI